MDWCYLHDTYNSKLILKKINFSVLLLQVHFNKIVQKNVDRKSFIHIANRVRFLLTITLYILLYAGLIIIVHIFKVVWIPEIKIYVDVDKHRVMDVRLCQLQISSGLHKHLLKINSICHIRFRRCALLSFEFQALFDPLLLLAKTFNNFDDVFQFKMKHVQIKYPLKQNITMFKSSCLLLALDIIGSFLKHNSNYCADRNPSSVLHTILDWFSHFHTCYSYLFPITIPYLYINISHKNSNIILKSINCNIIESSISKRQHNYYIGKKVSAEEDGIVILSDYNLITYKSKQSSHKASASSMYCKICVQSISVIDWRI